MLLVLRCHALPLKPEGRNVCAQMTHEGGGSVKCELELKKETTIDAYVRLWFIMVV